MGKNPVALPVGRAMTRASCEHVSKNISTQNRGIKAMFVRAGEQIGSWIVIKQMREAKKSRSKSQTPSLVEMRGGYFFLDMSNR